MLFKKKKVGPNLIWIDEFIDNVREYIYVREKDSLLIKRPNEVQKLNRSAVEILKPLLDGASIIDVSKNMTVRQQEETVLFFHALKCQLEGSHSSLINHPSVSVNPLETTSFERPVLSELAITYKCNLKCNFCYAGVNSSCSVHDEKEQMSRTEMKRVIDKIVDDAEAPSISFTGGEPTLSLDLIPLIKYAKKRGMRVNLITNGTLLTDNLVSTLVTAGLDSVQISLEATKEKLHDKIVGLEGAYVRAIEGLKRLQRTSIHVHTNTTITTDNLQNSLEFPKFVKEELGLERFSMNLLIPTGTAKDDLDLVVKYSEIGTFLDEIKKRSELVGTEFMWYSPLPMCIYNTITNGFGNKGCSACDGLLSVSCNGEILPCSSFENSIGNIKTDSFEELWKNKESVSIRAKELAPDKCKDCSKLYLCHGACPLYWNTIGTEELQNVETL